MSDKKTLVNTLRKLKKAVNDLETSMGSFSSPDVESNGAVDVSKKGNRQMPLEDLILLDGSLEGKRVRVLKDDGCNTNVVSRDFFRRNKKHLKFEECDVQVKHSNIDSIENSSTVILGATLKIGKHSYKSNWLVANCRYDVLLGMPWHVANNPHVDYNDRIIKIGKDELITNSNYGDEVPSVMNLSVKKFRSIMKKNSARINVFQLVPVTSSRRKVNSKDELCDPKLKKLVKTYDVVFLFVILFNAR